MTTTVEHLAPPGRQRQALLGGPAADVAARLRAAPCQDQTIASTTDLGRDGAFRAVAAQINRVRRAAWVSDDGWFEARVLTEPGQLALQARWHPTGCGCEPYAPRRRPGGSVLDSMTPEQWAEWLRQHPCTRFTLGSSTEQRRARSFTVTAGHITNGVRTPWAVPASVGQFVAHTATGRWRIEADGTRVRDSAEPWRVEISAAWHPAGCSCPVDQR